MNTFEIFKIKKNERIVTGLVTTILLILHYLMTSKFWCLFVNYSDASYTQFKRNYHMSGFDYFTYEIVSDWHHGFDVIRHPLLAEYWWPGYIINQTLWKITGANCAQLVVGAVLLFCGVYSFVFIYRTLVEVIGIRNWQATLLSLLFLSFGLIWVTLIVPDHFCLSMFCLTLVLYISGKKIKDKETFSIKETVVLFLLTSSVTLSNGALVLLMVLFTNGREFFEKKFFIRGVAIPCVVILSLALGMNRMFAKNEVKQTSPLHEQTKYIEDNGSKRLEVVQENFFGESLLLHRRNILGDPGWNRPLVVKYSWELQNYIVILLELLIIGGIIIGYRSRFSWLLASIILFNIFLHIVIGFAMKDVFIMVGHWGFTIPLIIGQLFTSSKRWLNIMLVVTITALLLYMYAYHGYLAHRILTWPLVK